MLTIFDVSTLRDITKDPEKNINVSTLCFSPDGLYLATAGDGLVYVSPLVCRAPILLNSSRCGKYLGHVSAMSSDLFTQISLLILIISTFPLMAISSLVSSIPAACKFGTVVMVLEGFSEI